MQTSQSIAVLGGSGAEGSGLALRLAKAGHTVVIGSRTPEKAVAVAAELNAILGGTAITWSDNRTAAAGADIVFLTVPYAGQKGAVEDVRDALAGKILVDATAPLVPPRVARVQLPAGGSAVAEIQAMLGEGVRVVSALQNVSAVKLRDIAHDVPCDVLVTGDDPAARETVIAILGACGMRGIDAGPIANSAAAEALTSVLIAINRKYKIPGAGIRITGLEES